MQIRPLLLATACWVVGACRAEESGKSPNRDRGISVSLPVFVWDSTLTASPELAAVNTPIAILQGGAIALGSSINDDGSPIVMMDEDGKLTSLGLRGRGPGELQTVADLFAGEGQLYAYDMSGLKLVALELEGETRAQHQFQGPVFPLHLIGDSVDVLRFSSRGRLEFQRVKFGSSEGRVLLDDRDSVFLTRFILPFEKQRSRQPVYPARATEPGKLAVGDPMQYRIYEFDIAGEQPVRQFGRDIPRYRRSEAEIQTELESLRRYRGPDGKPLGPDALAAQESRLREEDLPYFGSRKGMMYDDLGRLWVVGAHADSVAIDVFADSSFLGRVSIPCNGFGGSWARSASRAAFVCLDAQVPRLKVFNVTVN